MKQFLQLWPFYKKYRSQLVIMVVCGVLMSACQASLAPLINYLFDHLFPQNVEVANDKLAFIHSMFGNTVGNTPQVLVWAIPAFSVILYLFLGMFRYSHFFFMKFTGDRVAIDIREALLQKYLRLNLTFHN